MSVTTRPDAIDHVTKLGLHVRIFEGSFADAHDRCVDNDFYRASTPARLNDLALNSEILAYPQKREGVG